MRDKNLLRRIMTVGAFLGIVLPSLVVLPVLADSNHRNRGKDNSNDRSRSELNRRNDNDENEERFEERGFINENREIKGSVVFENKANNAISGTANVDVFLTKDNLHDVRIKTVIRNEPSNSNSVFEGWLVDSDSGFKLSLGGFKKMDSSGKAKSDFREFMVNFKIYDKLVVSEEPINDTNPNQSTIILEANIGNIGNMVPVVAMPIVETSALRGSSEAPSNTSSAAGFGVFVINTDKNTVDFHIVSSGLTGTETSAHIHGFASFGVNAPVVFTLPSGNPKNGVWNYLESQEADILAGKTYVNIHSTAFPDGEIRGQITP